MKGHGEEGGVGHPGREGKRTRVPGPGRCREQEPGRVREHREGGLVRAQRAHIRKVQRMEQKEGRRRKRRVVSSVNRTRVGDRQPQTEDRAKQCI